MYDFLIDMLECPVCHGHLEWVITVSRSDRLEEAEARCAACGTTYPVRQGIGLFLTPDYPRDDLWEQVGSGLENHLSQHPDIERLLLDTPLESLAPADQLFRSMVLEARGQYVEAQQAADLAWPGIYTPEYREGWQRQMEYVLERLSAFDGPVIDLASGRGYLVEQMLRRLALPVVVTDFSPRILRRNRQRLEQLGLYDRVSLLAFDARCTPFKDGAVQMLTSNLGMANIRDAAGAWRELRRIVGGTFLSISHFFPEDDPANGSTIRQHGLETTLFERLTLETAARVGWQVEIANVVEGQAQPTPVSSILDMGIDGLPVTETCLKWCTLVAC